MPIQILICEDEPLFGQGLREQVEKLLAQKKRECTLCLCNSGKEFAKALERDDYMPDLLFMDIGLGDSDGVKLIEDYRSRGGKAPVIFVSGMEDRVLDGYEVSALAFLYKRNYRDKLGHVMDRFLTLYGDNNKCMVREGGEITVVPIQDIYYLELDGRKTNIYLKDCCLKDERNITAIVEELPEDYFVEVYKCIYVNVEHVSRIDTDTVVLDNEKTVPLSRRKRKTTIQAMMRYMGGR